MRLDLSIRSKIHDYEVREVGDLDQALAEDFLPDKGFAIIDQRVAEIHSEVINRRIPEARRFIIPSSEEAKSYDSIGPVIEAVLGAGFQRSSSLCVIGGGVVQDIGCFIATNLMRGVAWTFYPTTLLAQCDSCIGAKSSVNIGRFKNQLGSFYPPNGIRIFLGFLDSLSRQELLSGFGEIVKLHLIESEDAFARISSGLDTIGEDMTFIREAIASSLLIKKRFIEEDEFDRGIRNLLNYGHTFAHAYESASHYAIPHGIAVTMGIVSATRLSEIQGHVSSSYFENLRAKLLPLYSGSLPSLRQVDPDEVMVAMKLDKKNTGAGITFILTKGGGSMFKEAVEHSNISNKLPPIINSL